MKSYGAEMDSASFLILALIRIRVKAQRWGSERQLRDHGHSFYGVDLRFFCVPDHNFNVCDAVLREILLRDVGILWRELKRCNMTIRADCF